MKYLGNLTVLVGAIVALLVLGYSGRYHWWWCAAVIFGAATVATFFDWRVKKKSRPRPSPQTIYWWEVNGLIGACPQRVFELWRELRALAKDADPKASLYNLSSPPIVAYFTDDPDTQVALGNYFTGSKADFGKLTAGFPAIRKEFFLRRSEANLISARVRSLNMEGFNRLLE